jgi:Fungal trichothecene efflux pump (TRI12)
MFPFCLAGFVTLPFVLSLKPRKETLTEKLRRVDWMGGFLFTASTTIFLAAISWGGSQEPWNSFRTFVPLIIGAVGMIAALFWEAYVANEPFLRHRLFHCRSSYAAYIGALVQGFLVRYSVYWKVPITDAEQLYGQLYYVPLYFMAVKAASPLQTGVNILATMCTLVSKFLFKITLSALPISPFQSL